MSRIIVTGGAGMIGSALTHRLRQLGHDVKVVDNLWRGRLENLLDTGGVPAIDFSKDFHQLDLSVPGQLEGLLPGTDYLFHLADIVAGIGYVFANERDIFRQNLLINSNTIAACARSQLAGFIYVGTACSFPEHLQTGTEAQPLVEADQYPAAPESAYGWSKLMGEYETFLMEAETRIPAAVLVLHNVYGSPCDYNPDTAQVIPALTRRVIESRGEPLVVWGSGEQGRAFVHVKDVVDALIATLSKGLGQGPIQIGPDVCTSIKEIAETIVRVSGKDLQIRFDASKPEGDRGRCANFSKAREILDWCPRVSLREGLEDVYSWIGKRIDAGAETTSSDQPVHQSRGY